jgi:hypothetical protein
MDTHVLGFLAAERLERIERDLDAIRKEVTL